MTSCVVDASVAAKWFLPPASEPHSAEAVVLLERFASGDLALLAPELLWPEVGNVLWKAVRGGRITAETARQAVEALARMNLRAAPMQPLLPEAFAIASAFGQTVSDAVYVALALGSGAPLVTADERLARALALHFPVRFLGALTGPRA